MIQYLGTRDRLPRSSTSARGARPRPTQVAVSGWPGDRVGHARVDVHASEVLTLADAHAIFEHFFLHAEPHPDYHWRTST